MARDTIVKKWVSFFRRSRSPNISNSSNLVSAVLRRPGHLTQRYASCDILDSEGVPNVIWYEDALAIYGGNTAVFGLYLLVPDESTAAAVLVKSGYKNAPIENLSTDDEDVCRGGIRLRGPGEASKNTTVLIAASEWNYDLNHRAMCNLGPLPPLNKFLDALMTHWLDIPKAEYSEKYIWAMSIAVLIGYAYDLPSPNDVVQSPAFAEELRPEVRELHYDIVGNYPKKSDFISFWKHEYHSLRCEQIREGKFTPRPYPTDNFPVSLAEYPELTGMDVDTDYMSRKKARKKGRRPLKSGPLESIDEDAG